MAGTDGSWGAWRRLHPLSPVLRGGRQLVVLLGVLGTQGLRQGPGAAVGLLVAGTLLAGVLGTVAWATTRFRVADGELQVDSGLLVRRARRVPLARVQSVDVVRPLVARVTGLAELRLEVAGGGDTEAPLAYLADAEARALRAVLLGATAGTAPGTPPQERVRERVLVQVPTGALVGSVLLGAPALVALVLLLALLAAAVVDPVGLVPPLLAAVAPGLLAAGGVAVRRVLAEYGATVAEVPEGLRLRSGLLDTRSATVPAGRVQTVRVVQPLLWRPWDRVRVEVDVAGYAGRGEERAVTAALLPVAPRALAEALVARVLGAPLPEADRRVPQRARWRAPLAARRLAVGTDGVHLVATSGVLVPTTDVVPLAKVQSLRLVQGPWQRRLGLASVTADTAGRRLPGATARHRDATEARRLLEELRRASAQARSSAGTSPAGTGGPNR